MAKQGPTVELSNMSGGLNRFDRHAEAMDNATVDALNVTEDDGELRRRDAFQAIMHGPPRYVPSGHSFIYDVAADQTYPGANNMNPASTELASGNIIIYSKEPFEGFEWRRTGGTYTGATAHAKLVVEYKTLTGWVRIPAIIDTTVGSYDDGTDIWRESLTKTGTVAWHKSHVADWTQDTIDSETWYGVRLSWINPVVGADDTIDGALTGTNGIIASVACFNLDPINGLAPAKFRNGVDSVIIGADCQNCLNATTAGAALGVTSGCATRTKPLRRAVHEGAAASTSGSDLPTVIPQSAVRSVNAWPSGAWAAGGGPAWTHYYTPLGSTLLKLRLDEEDPAFYEWFEDQFSNGVAATVTINSITTAGATWLRRVSVTSVSPLNQTADFYRGYALKHQYLSNNIATPSIIVKSTATSSTTMDIDIYHRQGLFPTGSEVGSAATVNNREDVYETLQQPNSFAGITENTDETLNLGSGAVSHTDFADPSDPPDVYFTLGRELNQDYRSGEFWDWSFDTTTKQVLMTNGQSAILGYDGRTLRSIEPLNDPRSARVREWVGALPDQERYGLQPHELAASKLRGQIPPAKFIEDFRGRIVLASLGSRGYDIAYSAPAPDSDIWPLGYTDQIRDSENNEISGMRSLHDRLLVWTPTSVHASGLPDDNGRLGFYPISQGVGFAGNECVVRIGQSALIGASSDGVYLYDGFEMKPLLDDWRRLLKGGVNKRLLHLSVAGVSLHKNEIYMAVPSSGCATNDKLLVYNYLRQKWWVWDIPWGGISSIARDYDEFGNEEMLFGFQDGTVARMIKADTDDGDAIYGYAKSPMIHPRLTATVQPVAVLVTMYELSDSQLIDFKTYINRGSEHFTNSERFIAGTKAYDAAHYNCEVVACNKVSTIDTGSGPVVCNPSNTSSCELVTTYVNLRSGTKCEGFQYSVGGSGQWKLRQAELKLSEISGHRS